MDYILNKHDLVRYMSQVHLDEYGRPISRIKMQKGLYFLFVNWVDFVEKNQNVQTEFTDILASLSNRLFETKFQALPYGPVDKEIYEKHKRGEIEPFTKNESNQFLDSINELTSAYLRVMTKKIFNSSDFGLVDLSHEDQVWKDNYDEEEAYHDKLMPEEDIVREYGH